LEEEAEEDEPLLFLDEDRLELCDLREIDSEERLISVPERDSDWFVGETLVKLDLLRLESMDEPLRLPVA
jgi:hypothetical protein